MKKTCVVCVATGIYTRGLNRLKKGLANVGFDGDLVTWEDSLPQGSPAHNESPMGFKPCAMKFAIEGGYRYVLWLDANCVPIRSLDRLFSKIHRDGYYLYSLGSMFGEWCSDLALETFGVQRERALSILEVNTSCVGLDAESRIAMNFLEDWQKYALEGLTFRGIDMHYPLSVTATNEHLIVSSDKRVKGHRHDQTCASFLAWKYRMRLSSLEVANFQYVGPSGENRYSRAIPLTALVVQCRDAKRERSDYLAAVDKYGNNKGLQRLVFFILSIGSTIKKIVSSWKILSILKQKDYYKDLPC